MSATNICMTAASLLLMGKKGDLQQVLKHQVAEAACIKGQMAVGMCLAGSGAGAWGAAPAAAPAAAGPAAGSRGDSFIRHLLCPLSLQHAATGSDVPHFNEGLKCRVLKGKQWHLKHISSVCFIPAALDMSFQAGHVCTSRTHDTGFRLCHMPDMPRCDAALFLGLMQLHGKC